MEQIILGIAVPIVILGGLIYIYIDVYLHPGSYTKPRKKKRNRRSK